jgi:O-glycosyl hydrolase
MTETSGYVDTWEKSGDKPGALSLALDIQTSILYGDVSAWVWWQGSDGSGIDEFSLMSDVTTGKKYNVSKHFYRFVRPGAERISANSDDDDVSVTAFHNAELGTHTLVIINASAEARAVKVNMSGAGSPTEYEMFVTSASKNCESAGTKPASSSFSIPARSVVTLQAGGNPLGKP